MDLTPYTNFAHLTGTMAEFGRYRVLYEPPADAVEADISMSISSDATLPQMLELFESFLQAAGCQIDGRKLELLNNDFFFNDFPAIDFNCWDPSAKSDPPTDVPF